jgi:hypothetical protein
MMTAEESTGRADLSDLVRARIEELGISVRSLADAAIDPENPEGEPLWKRGTLDNLLKGNVVKAPTLPQLRALAAGLRLPLGRVQEAAGAQWFGIDTVWSEGAEVRALVHDFAGMTPEDQARVRAIIRSWRELDQG